MMNKSYRPQHPQISPQVLTQPGSAGDKLLRAQRQASFPMFLAERGVLTVSGLQKCQSRRRYELGSFKMFIHADHLGHVSLHVSVHVQEVQLLGDAWDHIPGSVTRC